MNIAIAGTGYVGLSNGILLAQHNKVTALDIVPEKVELLNSGISPIVDREIEAYLAEKELNFIATLDPGKAFGEADFIIISTPTNYDPEKNRNGPKPLPTCWRKAPLLQPTIPARILSQTVF